MEKQQEILMCIQQVVREILKNDSIVLDYGTTSSDVKGWDSLTHMLIMAEVEKRYGIRISFRELMKVGNVGDLVSMVEKKVN